jgi:molybdate transport system ATP-binding protein
VLSGVYRTDVPRRRPAAEQRSRALAVLRRLGVVHLAERRFLELSRGEQRRVLIARGVAFEPTVLLLDEPASGLDRDARAELAAMLARVAAERTLVCTAHVPEDLPPMIERYLRLEQGRITAIESRRPTTPPPGLDAAPAAERPAAAAAVARAELAPAGPPLVVIEHANVWLGSRQVLHDLDWRLEPGQQWLVTGPNGSGKSSLLRLLHGQLRPALGSTITWPALGNPQRLTLRRQTAGYRRSCRPRIAIRRPCAPASLRASSRALARHVPCSPKKPFAWTSCSRSLRSTAWPIAPSAPCPTGKCAAC